MASEQVAAQAAHLDQETHTREDVEVLYKIYMDKRLQAQISFYESRVRENQLNADFTFTLGAAVMTLSSLVATISANGQWPVLSLLAATLPALAALLTSFRQLYGWERQINIYRDALMGLERVKLMAPDEDRKPLTDLQAIYPKLVSSGETVFTAEVNQWGQFVQAAEAPEETVDSRTMTALTSNLNLTDEQLATIQQILAASTPKPTVTVQTPVAQAATALPAGTVMGSAVSASVVTSELMDQDQMAAAAPPSGVPLMDSNEDDVIFAAPEAIAPTIAVAHEAPPPESDSALAPGARHVEATPPNDPEDEEPTSAG